MRLNGFLKGCAIALATVGIALPHAPLYGAGTHRESTPQSRTRVADVALAPGGVLKGQVVTSQGVARQGATVSVQQEGREVARVLTDQQGNFTAPGLKGGTYLVATEGAVGPVRAWSHNTAPPAASAGILLVPQSVTALGQGQGLLGGGSLLTNPGLLITAGFIGTIIAVAVTEDAS